MKIILSLLACIAVVLFGLTLYVQKSSNQAVFLAGTVPSPLPDGQYKGSAQYTGSWLGKKFDASTHTGINVFKNGNSSVEKYPFKSSVGKGIKDANLTVLKIDYNLPENAFWLRPILDEIVQIAPNKYLGKLHIRVGSLFTFSIAYFGLEK